jgi:membrane protein
MWLLRFTPLLILKEAFSSFRKNNDMNMAASMAFYTALSIVPALFLITYIAGYLIGSSEKAFIRIQELIMQFIPKYSEIIMREVKKIIGLKKGVGIINLMILLWSILPLSSSIRSSLGIIFRIGIRKPYLIEKLFDVLIIVLFILVVSLIAIRGLLIDFVKSVIPFFRIPIYAGQAVSFIVVLLLFLFLYWAFTFNRSQGSEIRLKEKNSLKEKSSANVTFATNFRWPVAYRSLKPLAYLFWGAFSATCLWFLMKPLFNLMLSYNPGYGLTFGSFKSIFIVIIWIYYSQIVFLFGAEIASALQRKEALILKEALTGSKGLPEKIKDRYVITYRSGEVIFNEGDRGDRMFYILNGRVGVEKSGKFIAILEKGNYIGELSFLLGMPRSATVKAIEDTEVLTIDFQNIERLASEMPELIREILRQMALRVQRTTEIV